ncbi:FmdB family zinc ribbon protein [Allonocardiopsis opalescens]|uniref:Putative FmdB family regulatory protein n=1 Tax=Allonocardiopsis opalescens TaxID=1144618 RepID=A0A2T0Q9E8_9ACTN|nr:FmdB family zinc ribbon protein [Allonocardiopsis opalescens]PRY00442.1 putative FmdB family regulatory protein [Allonocardiopsis opalescens]
MPTYQYACTSCDTKLEVVQKFSDDPLTTCPECEGRLRKLYSAVGIVFKGSGFYRTDSRSGSSSVSSSANGGSKDSGGSADSGSSSAKESSGSDASSTSSSSSSSASSSSSSGASSSKPAAPVS